MKKHNWYVIFGLIITGLLAAMVVLSCFWTPYDPTAMMVGPKLSGPSLQHLMGTDSFGRDIFSRVMKGTWTTFPSVCSLSSSARYSAPFSVPSPATLAALWTIF